MAEARSRDLGLGWLALHRPPNGEVSTPCHRQSGGEDVLRGVHGVLLAEVAAVLQERNPAVEVAHVRAQCEALDIPVRDRIKVSGQVSVGVHINDLLAVWDVEPGPPPPRPSREWNPAVSCDNYPTTPAPGPLSEGDSCTVHESGGEVTT